jgi:hypothetical protein
MKPSMLNSPPLYLGPATYFGPGSAYSTGLLGTYKNTLNSATQWVPGMAKSISSLPRIVVQECIALFFRWQQPYSTMIDSDAFMSDYMSGSPFGEDCSTALLYIVCALGALMSQDKNIQELASVFSSSAQDLIFSKSFWIPHLSKSQAMLLCSVYEIGKGNASKSWMYSGLFTLMRSPLFILLIRQAGMAFRMAQDLGLHETNQLPTRGGPYSGVSFVDLESRRRMSLTYSL